MVKSCDVLDCNNPSSSSIVEDFIYYSLVVKDQYHIPQWLVFCTGNKSMAVHKMQFIADLS